jgi:hypothetical protein
VPTSNCAAHVEPQPIPAGEENTDPRPAPASATRSVRCSRAKVAVTDVAAETVTVHAPAPWHAPDQP